MNRRSFLASTVSAGALSVNSSDAQPTGTRPPERLSVPPRAKWIEDGVNRRRRLARAVPVVVRRGANVSTRASAAT